MTDEPLLEKTVNVLLPNPELSTLWKVFSWGSWGILNRMIRGVRFYQSGLWAGGTLLVYRDKIFFRPNALNRAFLKSDETIEFPIVSISAVTPKFGMVTGIVEITHNGDRFVFRCFGSKKAARLIADLAKVA